MADTEWPYVTAGTGRAFRRFIVMGSPRSWLVVNSRSGSNSDAAYDSLLGALAMRGLSPDRIVEFPAQALPTPTSLRDDGVTRLVVFTGDGSLNAVIAALSGWDGEILVLPGGTMNLMSARLHGQDVACEEILDCISRGAYRPIRPMMARCDAGSALAGLLVGPGTAWAEVREAMRDFDVAGLAQGAGEAIAETTGGSRVRLIEPVTGHKDGYPLIELTPSHRGLQVDGYRPESASDILQQGWAVLRRRFREGPHERLGLLDRVRMENCAGEPLQVLIDGEPATLPPQAEFTVADCPVDLLATSHGF